MRSIIYIHLNMLLAFAAALSACSLDGPNRYVEIIGKTNKVDQARLAPRHYRAIEYCEKAVEAIPAQLFASLASLSSEQRANLKWPERLASYKVSQCKSFKKRGTILSDLHEIFGSKSQRVGIILPASSSNESALKIILEQMNLELARAGFTPEKTLIVRRIQKDRDHALKAASELVHIERVSMLIGGLTYPHASAIVEVADLSQTPALIVSANAGLGRTSQSMRVYPPVKRLALRLADKFKSQDVKNVVVLRPHNANIELYQLLRSQLGGSVNYAEASYNPDQPQSILDAVKSQTAIVSRVNSRSAVLILDNFRMVRHIVNIVATSLPGQNIIFAGNQQWRSPALVVPRDDALQGAIFVDFIGNYRNLPQTIDTPLSDNDYFTTAQAASRIDYQIIGHRLGNLAAEAARFGFNRYETARRLQSMNNKWDSYFPKTDAAIDSERESSWPVFMFRITEDNIEEI